MRITSLFGFLLALAMPALSQTMRQMPLSELRDRIQGGWAGQMIGVSYGAPTEFRSNAKINEGELPPGSRSGCRILWIRMTSTWT